MTRMNDDNHMNKFQLLISSFRRLIISTITNENAKYIVYLMSIAQHLNRSLVGTRLQKNRVAQLTLLAAAATPRQVTKMRSFRKQAVDSI